MTLEQFVQRALSVPFVDFGRDWSGWDCWGVILVAYRELYGIALPHYLGGYSSTEALVELRDLIAANRDDWRETKQANAGDVALLKIGGVPVHVGLMIDRRRILHAERDVGTVIEPLFGAMWGRRVEGLYAHAARI